MSVLHAFSAGELSAAYATKQLSPVEVTQAVLLQIERREPELHALYACDPEAALAQARASETRWQRGEPLSPIDGVPGTLKENIATRGCPMPVGTAATVLAPMADDAPPAARWREAGLVLLAKTTMPDYGMLSSGLSSFHALARNPWDTGKNPGGSSAGAAAAAAAGYGPLHVGTDIGGSIRLPAGWCGLVGFKPSLGRIPIKPPYAGRAAGPMTRTVEDAAWLMTLLSKPDWRDTMSLPYQSIPWLSLDREVRGLKIGLQMDAGWGLAVEPETRAAIEAAALAFEAAGAIVEPVAPFSTRAMIDGLDRFWRMRSYLDMQALPPERQAKVLPYIRDWVATGATLTAAEVFHGYSQMGVFREAAVAACRPYDFVLSPVSPVPSFPAEWASPINDPALPFEHIAFTLPYNMSEQPAVSVHCGFTAGGLPIGLQIIGQRHDDLGVLQLARAWEQLRSPMRPWPM
ncbi:amidase [Aquabacterium sp.]|uniref:amidase n=1 Tax=Aquabacterium sp. TaxID=1872578 RepID=UPI002BEF2F98|nr:amidase [Aquabacterium sp.]HSW03412.1 amidase [Aquabacterium sp.]